MLIRFLSLINIVRYETFTCSNSLIFSIIHYLLRHPNSFRREFHLIRIVRNFRNVQSFVYIASRISVLEIYWYKFTSVESSNTKHPRSADGRPFAWRNDCKNLKCNSPRKLAQNWPLPRSCTYAACYKFFQLKLQLSSTRTLTNNKKNNNIIERIQSFRRVPHPRSSE